MKICVDGIGVIHATPTGLKAKTRDKVLPAGVFLASFNKSDARKIRKALRSSGHADKAGAKRAAA